MRPIEVQLLILEMTLFPEQVLECELIDGVYVVIRDEPMDISQVHHDLFSDERSRAGSLLIELGQLRNKTELLAAPIFIEDTRNRRLTSASSRKQAEKRRSPQRPFHLPSRPHWPR